MLAGDRAQPAALSGIRLSYPDGADGLAHALADNSVTDLCWFWGSAGGAPSADRLREEWEHNYRDLLAVMAALTAAGPSIAPRLWLVTERAQWLPGDQPGTGEQLAAATLWGFAHTMLNEYPKYRPTLVDLPAGGDLSALAAEWQAPDTGEFQVGYRDGQRYVRRLLAGEATAGWNGGFEARAGEPGKRADPVLVAADELDEADEAFAAVRDGDVGQVVLTTPSGSAGTGFAPATVRSDRVYLITGGLGGLGLVTAAHLVGLGARHLVLVSRSGQPRPESADLLAALRARAEVTVVSADLGSPPDIEQVFMDVRRRGILLGGIVHAAGVAGTSLIAAMTWEAIDEQLRAQAYGGWLLHEASLEFPELDFFVVYSSISSVIGGVTQAHYAAAFAFLDGLVGWRARLGLPALAMNWGAWSRVGVSARLDEKLARELERGGIRYFSPARALRTFDRLLSGSATQCVIGQWDWNRHVGTSPLDNALYSRLVGRRAPGEAGLDVGALLAKPKPDRVAAIEKVVLASVTVALHADDEDGIDPATKFVALGLDSLMALDVKTSLESAFRLPLPASLTFDHPSPQQLAEFLDEQLVPADKRG
jgi:acyl carrier protein